MQLRRITEQDADLMLAIWNDPAFIQHVADRGIRTIKQAQEAIQQGILKLYQDYDYGPLRVALRDTDQALGICGLFKRENLEHPDIGFALLPEFCGRGYTYEASVAVLTHTRDQLQLPRVCAIVSPANKASIGLILKLGMLLKKPIRMPGDDHDILLYGMDLATA